MTASTTTATSPANNKTQRRTKKKLTNHNTDVLCCDSKNDSWISTFIYRINLWTGLYMLNSWERAVFQIFGWVSTVAFLVYVTVFLSGFVEGFTKGFSDPAMHASAVLQDQVQINDTMSASTEL